MSRSGKCNELSVDVGLVFEALRNYYLDALRAASDQLISIMQKEVLQTVWGAGPGKPEWRQMIQSKINTLYEDVTDHYLGIGVGLPDTMVYEDFIKAMVVAYGAGSAVGSPPIHAGPAGREVWDGNLDFKRPSKAETEYDLPEKFNQEGNHFVENAMRIMRKHFDDVLDSASAALPDGYFYRAVKVKPR